MKTVKVKVVKDFNDRTADLLTRKADKDVLDVTPEQTELCDTRLKNKSEMMIDV